MLLNFDGSVSSNFSHYPYYYSNSVSRVVPTELNEYIYGVDDVILFKTDLNGSFIDSSWTRNFLSEMIRDTLYSEILPQKVHYNYFFLGTEGKNYPYHFRKVLPNGFLDSTFSHNTDKFVYKIIDYDLGKVLVAGYFNHYDNLNYNLLCRIDTLGNIDTSFHNIFINSSPIFTFINECYVQSDGKIIVAGTFKINSSNDSLGLIRLLPNGELDSTFNNFNNINQFNLIGGCNTICATMDGGYLIGGFFTQYQNQMRSRIAKIDANGFLDSIAFNGYGIDSIPALIPLTLDITSILKDTGNLDRYYVMGSFESYNNQSVKPIMRLNGLNVGIKEIETSTSSIKIFPNPSHNLISIILKNAEIDFLTLRDLTGKVLLQQKENKIDLTDYSSGMFLLNVTDKKKKTHFSKVIKY